ncbi:MAG: hypothetical protein JRI55_32555 [Deltaproteobacteria bacterium]|jgi:hypothetical protein|nr:hypothetical protein [Deltaproteobacteria bacterium]
MVAALVGTAVPLGACSDAEEVGPGGGGGSAGTATSPGGAGGGIATPTDGRCGSADGTEHASAPTSGLCDTGSASAVAGTGPWTWTCAGERGGADAACSAPLTAAEVAGPSATLFEEHPYYSCVHDRYIATAANGGSDSADGMAPTVGGGHGPWETFEHANASIPNPAPGYCIHVGDGTYTVESSIHMDHGGSEASQTGFTVWRAMNLLGAKLVATSAVTDIVRARVPYLIFDGFELDGGHFPNSEAGIGACLPCCDYNGMHHVFVLNSYIHHMGGNGIATCWGDYFWVIHNRLDQNAYNSWNSGASMYEPMEIPGYVPTAYDEQWAPYRNVYAYNRCFGNFTSPAGSPHTDGNGIIYDDSRHEQQVPHVPYPHRALIMGNIAWGNGGWGIQVGPTSSNVDVFNNTAYDNGLDTYNDGTWRGEISSAMGSGNTFANNIGYAIVGDGILANNAPFLGGNPVDATNAWNHNIAFGAPPNMTAPDAFPTPANQVDADPLFLDRSAANFALGAGSPAIGFGAVVPHWQQQTAGDVDVGACPRSLSVCP